MKLHAMISGRIVHHSLCEQAAMTHQIMACIVRTALPANTLNVPLTDEVKAHSTLLQALNKAAVLEQAAHRVHTASRWIDIL